MWRRILEQDLRRMSRIVGGRNCPQRGDVDETVLEID
jgi:hypothetical protein